MICLICANGLTFLGCGGTMGMWLVYLIWLLDMILSVFTNVLVGC